MKKLLILSLLLLAPALAWSFEAPTPFTAAEKAAARQGEVLVTTTPGTINRGQVVGLVRAPMAAVSQTVRDTNTHSEWFPDMVNSRRVSEGVHTGRTHLPIIRDRYWRLNSTFERIAHEGSECEAMFYTLDDTYERNNMRVLFGYWLLCPEGTGTMVKYVINADLGIPLPNFVIDWAQARMLPGLINNLNERLAGGN